MDKRPNRENVRLNKMPIWTKDLSDKISSRTKIGMIKNYHKYYKHVFLYEPKIRAFLYDTEEYQVSKLHSFFVYPLKNNNDIY